MRSDFAASLAQLTAEKGLGRDDLMVMVEAAIASAYKKDDLEYADVVVTVDRATGDEHVKRRYLIMDDDDIEDDEIQMSPEKARALGLGGLLLNQVFWTLGMSKTTVLHSSMIMATTPLWVLLMFDAFLRNAGLGTATARAAA